MESGVSTIQALLRTEFDCESPLLSGCNFAQMNNTEGRGLEQFALEIRCLLDVIKEEVANDNREIIFLVTLALQRAEKESLQLSQNITPIRHRSSNLAPGS
jgi:hypothetical protein